MLSSDVVGSLLRPQYLKEARARHDAGKLNDADFKRVEDRGVDEALALQERAGVAVVTDGEMRRYAFYGHLIDAVEGFDKYGGWAIPFRNEAGEELVLQRPVVVSRLQRKRHMCAEEFTYLRARTKLPAKTTLISAQQAAAYYDIEKSRSAYPTIDVYLADLVDILRGEIDELIRWDALIFKSTRLNIRPHGSGAARRIPPARQRSRSTTPLSIEMDNAVISNHPGVFWAASAAATIKASSTLAVTMVRSPGSSRTLCFSVSSWNLMMKDLGALSRWVRFQRTEP